MFIKSLGTAKKNERLATLLAKMPKEEIATFAARHPKIAKLYGIGMNGAKVVAPIAYGTSEAVSDLPPSDEYDEADKIAQEEAKNIPDDTEKDSLSLGKNPSPGTKTGPQDNLSPDKK